MSFIGPHRECLICGEVLESGEGRYCPYAGEWFCEADYAGGFDEHDDDFEDEGRA